MDILSIGALGYQVGAAGIVAFTLCYLVAIKWWTDWLGRVLAGVLFTTSAVLVTITLRQLNPDLAGHYFVWRAIAFWGFGLAVWASWATFLWAQFFAPRLKHRTTRKDKQGEQEADLADSRSGRDGDPDDRSGSLL